MWIIVKAERTALAYLAPNANFFEYRHFFFKIVAP